MLVKLFYVLFIAGVSARSIRSTEDNAESDTKIPSCSCDKRYWAHYEVKGCHPVFEEDNLDCPTRFDCPDSKINDSQGCVFRGVHYDIGSQIRSSDPCHMCYCRHEYDNSSLISCAYVECPESFGQRPTEGCHSVYDESSCCAVETKCDPEESPKCEWNGKKYFLGQKIYPEEDECLVCICTEDWKGINSSSCHKVNCLIEADEHLLRKGCVPIYHEKTCCPIEIHCPKNIQDVEERNDTLIAEKDSNKCYFDGKAYSKGELLECDNPTGCVTCTCCTPPDFTCVHRSCPPPSQNQSECSPIYTNGVCCPEYECPTRLLDKISEKKEASVSEKTVVVTIGPPAESACSDIECEEGEQCELKQICEETVCSIFPKCVPTLKNGCPTPHCDIGCYVVRVDKDKCPTCACGNSSIYDAKEVCILPNCTGSNCHLVSNENGCPVCSCDPPCPECPADCQLEIDIPEGRCPACLCNDTNDETNGKISEEKVTVSEETEVVTIGPPAESACTDIECEEGEQCELKEICKETVCSVFPKCVPALKSGCPTPQCDTGCYIVHVDKDKCPTCACGNGSIYDPNEVCILPNCTGSNCHLVSNESGCPVCSCDPPCPECPADCQLETDIPEGRCPGCICNDINDKTNASNESTTEAATTTSNTETPKCPELKCRGYKCRILIGTDDCQFCICESKCPPTKCIPGCFVDPNPLPDQCPGCVCHVAALSKDAVSNES